MWPFRRQQSKPVPVERTPPAGEELPQFGPETVDQVIALLEAPTISCNRLRMTLIMSGFAVGFNWVEWRDGEGLKLIRDPSLIDAADVMDIRKLFTYLWRQDHFCEGVLRAALDAGVPQRALRRLAAIREAR